MSRIFTKTCTDQDKSTFSRTSLQGYADLLRFARRKGLSQTDASDIVQDAYVRLMGATGRYDVHNPGAFLRITTINLIRDYWRMASARSNDDSSGMLNNVPCGAPSAERTVNGKQELRVLERALQELPSKRRAALVLYRFDNLSHAEIAERLGLSISMVEKHVRLALNHCRRRLNEASGGMPNAE